MSDAREFFLGKGRSQLDDAHTAKMYATFAKRAEMVNSLISLVLVAAMFTVLASVVCLTALAIWVWRVLV